MAMCLNKFLNRKVTAAWGTWAGVLIEKTRQHNMLAHALKRLTHRLIGGAFASWAEIVVESEAEAEAVEAVLAGVAEPAAEASGGPCRSSAYAATLWSAARTDAVAVAPLLRSRARRHRRRRRARFRSRWETGARRPPRCFDRHRRVRQASWANPS